MSMKIIIIGAGIMGSHLAKYLLNENHEVCVIEENEKIARIVQDKFDVKVVIGNGADPAILKKVSIAEADLVLAVTASDELNVVACSLASYLGARQQIARVRSPELHRIISQPDCKLFSVDKIINPEHVAADAIVKIIHSPGVREIADFADSRILLRSLDVSETSPFCGVSIQDLRDENFPWPFLIIVIIREGKVFIPKGDFIIKPQDRIYALLPVGSMGEFLTFVNPHINIPKKIVIYGASDIGKEIAETLAKDIREVFIIEENAQTAEELASELRTATVLKGSGSEEDILKESGIETADVFIGCSKNDHSNLISALLAKKMGAKISIITTQQPDYISIADALNIDAIISPQILSIYQIISMVRGKGVRSVVKIMDCDVEVLELVPENGSAITKGPLKTLNIPRDSIIGAVSQGEDVFLAHGDTVIQPGEKVIAFSRESSSKKLQSLFIKKTFF